MPVSLNALVQTYLDDKEFQDETNDINQSREKDLPTFELLVKQFLDKTIDIYQFRERLDKALVPRNSWGLRGPEFLMEMNKLAKNHASNGQAAMVESRFREILTGLDARNVGERIGLFHTFVLQEQTRLKNDGLKYSAAIYPANTALIISVFAFWLDWSNRIIYYLSMRQGLKTLIDAGILTHIGVLKTLKDRVVVESAVDHQAVVYLVEQLAEKAPQLQDTGRYWVERFLFWITEHPEALIQDESLEDPTFIDMDGSSEIPLHNQLLMDASEEASFKIEHKLLAPISETLLAQRIMQLREHILIDEKVIRRIYQALLAGHVILTGPPGTGKTVLAQLIPELLWKTDKNVGDFEGVTDYTSQLVTATDEWSVRTLIGGLTPTSVDGQVVYRTQFGHLTTAIVRNWTSMPEQHKRWGKDRIIVTKNSAISGKEEFFRGLWLIIDEFNRAPIDLALGDALTALGSSNGGVLRVPTDDGIKDLPIPKDFRIIGTLNSFDRNYLNQISEALKRRFSFIEVLPPNRTKSFAEQEIVLRKVFESIEQIGIVEKVTNNNQPSMYTDDNQQWAYKELDGRQVGVYTTQGFWLEEEKLPNVVELAQSVIEVIRIYRQLGTAQFITLVKSMFIAMFLDPAKLSVGFAALDNALCDTIADQLQVLLPDELEALYQYVKRTDNDAFIDIYNKQLSKLAPRRLKAQLEALSNVVDGNGQEILSEDEVEQITQQNEPRIAREKLVKIFRLGEGTFYPLPQFARRLRVFKAERGL